jgi:23S rRNA pseudouridine1911/1915/1917 synthase
VPRLVKARAGSRPAQGVRILFEDELLAVVEKPAGLLTIATSTERRRTLYAALSSLLAARRPPERVFIVHRLDREASGLLVLAKTAEAKKALQGQFRRREAGRTYSALVEGNFPADDMTLRSYLAENAAYRVYSATPKRGKLALTHVRVLRRLGRRTLLQVSLETGRKHQIRVQLAELGHPIVGDGRYGSASPSSRRMALHAAALTFRHPRTGRQLTFESRREP